MKAKYTKRQILESIAYWRRQLAEGNYKNVDEQTIDGENRGGKPMKRVFNDSTGHVTVSELREMAEVLFDGQEGTLLNVGQSGEIYGQVNQVLDDSGTCILTLAPYRNGRRSKNLSVNGCFDAPLKIQKIVSLLAKFPGDAQVIVRMKDPYGFGPSANVPVECPAEAIDIDSTYGIFLRVCDE